MPRFAVIDDNVVVGVLAASTPPSIDVPANRLFVDVTELPDIRGGEIYDPVLGMFSQPGTTLEARVALIESSLQASGVMITPETTPKVV